ncbi:MAG: bifunctional alpha,alpha-trehalose-phosphate synthase (UDP-forming)/trehalose-phosphatase [Ignavibacteriales bacterium]|nr:bifunctional alpha,alpha-trehalose-phosphate synthase (UDP-forming)/trehalose-phosphatase [Ignavibacteriales bacterium]
MSTSTRKIIIVANRLPVTIQGQGSGIELVQSVGGLSTGLSSLPKEYQSVWVGWPGLVRNEDKKEIEKRLVSEFNYHPIFLNAQMYDKYYVGYSNRTIWPIFHSFLTYAKFASSEWDAYKKVNQHFCAKVTEVYNPGDIIWIQDYHLLLLPNFLRERIPKAVIGFFLHIPFPSYEMFRLIPQHRDLLENMLGADLIGFHTHDYQQAFLGSVRRVLGHDNMLGQLTVNDRFIYADVVPMGIDFEKFSESVLKPDMSKSIAKMKDRFKTRKMILSVSRLDYTKGIPESLEAIKIFFERYPEWHEKLIFFLVIVPSREKVERYASLKREIDELVGNINSSFGTLYWVPVGYVYRSLTTDDLIVLYANADIALITPLRDGMNLIAKEYLAVKNGGAGVLIISELAGSAKELQEAIVVNPNSSDDVISALHRALNMPEEEQIHRNLVMRDRLKTHDIADWVKRFIERLKETIDISLSLSVRMLDAKTKSKMVHDFKNAKHRLIVTDYDGTLVPFEKLPMHAKPSHELLDTLRSLSAIPETRVVVLSGRDRETLQKWLGTANTTLVSEHGGWMKDPSDEEWKPLVAVTNDAWKKDVRPIMEMFVNRIPESFIEEKTFSLVWHYRNAEQESANAAARELLDTMTNFSTNLNIYVTPGDKIVEVRTLGVNKGNFFSTQLAKNGNDFIVALGDDWTDEDLFAALPEHAYSIKVGLRMSKARFNLKSHVEVRSLLQQLVKGSE